MGLVFSVLLVCFFLEVNMKNVGGGDKINKYGCFFKRLLYLYIYVVNIYIFLIYDIY